LPQDEIEGLTEQRKSLNSRVVELGGEVRCIAAVSVACCIPGLAKVAVPSSALPNPAVTAAF